MNIRDKIRFTAIILTTISLMLPIVGCEKNDAISAADQADKKSGMAAPSIIETKAIAEEAFIYGLPIVMNYAVMDEYAIDRNSGQFKAPFNQIKNEARVFTDLEHLQVVEIVIDEQHPVGTARLVVGGRRHWMK